MATYHYDNARHEASRLHNPWESFIHRNEERHNPEDIRLPKFVAQPGTSENFIERFMTLHNKLFHDTIPRRHQILRDYLQEACTETNSTVQNDIEQLSTRDDIALLDDRWRHPQCRRIIGGPCSDCIIFSGKVNVPELYGKLQSDRRPQKAEKRIIFIPNMTPAGALTLVATTATRTANMLRDFLHRYLVREHRFSIATVKWGFFLEFHLPYHAMRQGNPIRDRRKIRDEPLRQSAELPLREWSSDRELLCYHEAQTSSFSTGSDEYFWTEYFLVDTYYGSESNFDRYFENCPLGSGSDPPLGGQGTMENPCFDPREYWLLKVDQRVYQMTEEYRALIETFSKRMDEYFHVIRGRFHDEADRTHTLTLSTVIETTQIFIDTINATIVAWESFYGGSIKFFTTFAPDKPKWPGMIESIGQNMAELNRLRNLLLTRQMRFRDKFNSLHTVSSLSQTEKANELGKDIGTLTFMTVYVAFPLLFTTAFFGMEFMDLKVPFNWVWWIVFLVLSFAMNTVVGRILLRKEGRELVLETVRSIWNRLKTP